MRQRADGSEQLAGEMALMRLTLQLMLAKENTKNAEKVNQRQRVKGSIQPASERMMTSRVYHKILFIAPNDSKF